MQLIRKYKVDVHIDLGDLKDVYNPADLRVLDFAIKRDRKISRVVKYVVRLLGNHDRIGQYDDDNNWLKTFKRIGFQNVHYITRPRILKLDSVDFACLPYRKDPEETRKSAAKLCKRHADVLLFHNDVAGARYSKVQKRKSETAITPADMCFRKYKQCFGGHIHLPQELADNARFVGNPFATDFGEIDQQKSFIIYDTDAGTVTRIPSDIPGIYSLRYLKDKKIRDVPIGTRIKAEVKCDSHSTYRSKLDAVHDEILRRYPNAIPFVLPKFINEDVQETNSVDVDSSDAEMLLQYINATAPSVIRKQRKALVAYMGSVLADVSGRALSKSGGKTIFHSVEGRNVLSFRKVKFDLRKRGLVLIKGDNKDWPNHSNGAGKSSLLSLVPIAIAGETFKGQRNDAWASDLNTKTSEVVLTLSNDRNQHIEVIRARRPAKLQMRINGKDESSGLRNIGKTETQGQIESFTGLNFDTLANSVYIDQRLSNAFLTGTPKDRADLIHQFQNLDRFNEAKKIVASEQIKVRQQLELFELTYNNTIALIKELDDDLQRSKQNVGNELDALRNTFRDTKKTYAKTKKQLSKRIARLHRRHHSMQSLIRGIEKDCYSRDASINNASQQRDNVLKEIRRLTLNKETECRVCGRPYDLESKRKTQRDLSQSVVELDKQIAKLELQESNQRSHLKAIRVRNKTISEQSARLESQLSRDCNRKDSAHTAYRAAKQIADAQKQTNTKEKSKLAKHRLQQFRRAIKHNQRELEFLQFVAQAFSRDGLPAYISHMLIPRLNKAAKRYSDIFVDGEIQVLFEIEKSQIIPRVVNAHGGKTLQSQSMGENAWAGLITSFALRDIAQPSNLLILDEPGNGMDPESAKVFAQRLPKLKKHFETILVVTHNPTISAELDNQHSVTVVKQNKLSRLVEN